MSENPSRRKRLKRAKENLPALALTNRDIEIVAAVYLYRALSTKQLTALIYNKDKRSTQCETRLKKLFHHGYLYRRSQGTQYLNNLPLVYMLTEKGARLLVTEADYERDEINWKPKYNSVSNYHLAHVLAASDVRIALTRASNHLNVEFEFLDEMTIRRLELYDTFEYHTPTGWKKKSYLIPDGFFTLGAQETFAHYFLEVDRGTETLSRVADKFTKYLWYLETDAYADRYGAFDAQGIEVLPQICTITTSETRMQNLIEIALDVGADERFLFSTFEQAAFAQILDKPSWQRAGEETKISLLTS